MGCQGSLAGWQGSLAERLLFTHPPGPQWQCLELLPKELCGHGHEMAGAGEQRPLCQQDDE